MALYSDAVLVRGGIALQKGRNVVFVMTDACESRIVLST
jgi:hypothetical protein